LISDEKRLRNTALFYSTNFLFRWLDYFKESETKTSWIGSIFYAMPLLSGPVMSKLVERFGCKKMTIIGGAVSAVGFILSSLCTSIEQLYLTIGVIGGCGLSAAYIVGLVTVERWFEERRSLAIGIVSAGTGFGTFVFPPITQYCLDTFGWRLTLVSLSGLLMIVSLVGAFLDDPQWKIEEDAARYDEKIDRKSINADEKNVEDKNFMEKVKTFVDFSHFRDRNFALLGAATFLIYAFYNTAIYFMTELLKNFNYSDQQSANFLSIIGFFLMLGMVALGWSADRKKVNVIVLNSTCVLRKKF
jgi:MFS family permease